MQLVRLLEQVGLKQKEQCFPLATCPLTRAGVAETEEGTMLFATCPLTRAGWAETEGTMLSPYNLSGAGVAETEGTMLSPYNLSAYWSRLG